MWQKSVTFSSLCYVKFTHNSFVEYFVHILSKVSEAKKKAKEQREAKKTGTKKIIRPHAFDHSVQLCACGQRRLTEEELGTSQPFPCTTTTRWPSAVHRRRGARQRRGGGGIVCAVWVGANAAPRAALSCVLSLLQVCWELNLVESPSICRRVVVGEQGNEHTSVSTCMLSQRPRIDLNERSLHRTMTNVCYETPQERTTSLASLQYS